VKGSINGPMDISPWRLRINGYTVCGVKQRLKMAVRRLPIKQPTLKDIGLTENVRIMVDNPRGLILVTGSTGSGKSTTVSAMVDCINEARSYHILTIEDPIEYVFTPKKSTFSQREIGSDCPTFFDGVYDAMRQRPNVIIIGEIRDRETAEAALLAAESGHLVIGTVHGNNVSGAIHKLLSLFPKDERDSKRDALSSTLLGVISQILLPNTKKDGYVLAAELLFNHKQQCSEMLGDAAKVNGYLQRKDDKLNRSMAHSLHELVASGKLEKGVALAAAGIGQPVLMDLLKSTV